jgi:hypothetical protein
VEKVKSRVRRLTLQKLLAENSEIWVRNRSAKVTGKAASNVVMQVSSGSVVDSVIIPPGRDPVCLTDQVTAKMLSECMDLFKLVKSRVLELLDPSEADAYYAQNQERLKVVTDKVNKILSNVKEDTVPRKAQLGNIEIHPRVGDICLKARHAAISEREAVELLMEQEDALTIEDYNYILSNGVFNSVKSWAQDQIALKTQALTDPVEAASSK